jgi:hypothetical protein
MEKKRKVNVKADQKYKDDRKKKCVDGKAHQSWNGIINDVNVFTEPIDDAAQWCSVKIPHGCLHQTNQHFIVQFSASDNHAIVSSKNSKKYEDN